jgi:hypothetical protein
MQVAGCRTAGVAFLIMHPASALFLFRNRPGNPTVFHPEPSELSPAMPYTGIVLAIVGAHAAAFLVLLGHWVVAAGMFPQATRAFADVYDRRPIRATLLGILTYGPLFLLLLNNAKVHIAGLRFLAVTAGVAALLIAFVGSAGLALRIGRNLGAGTDTWRQILRGGVMLALVFITPLIGWLLVMHLGLASGFGAFLLARPWKSAAPATLPLQTVVPGMPAVPAAPVMPPPPVPAIPSLT